MAATEAMGVTLRAEFKDFEKALLKARNETDTKLAAIGRDFEKANNKVKTEAKGLSGAMGDLTRGIPGLSGGLSLVGVAGAAAAGGVVALVSALRGVQEASKFAADLTDTADRIGVTVEALQALRFAADETGVPLANLDKGLENLNASLGAFKTGIGAGRITPIFEALGLTKADLEAVENAEQLLPILADRLGQVSDRATQVQLARKLGIEELLPLLRQGSAGIATMSGEARDLGLVLSNDVVSGLDATDRALERNQQQIDANVREMQAGLAPFFVWATGELAKLARGFTDFFNGLQRAENRSDRVLENQVARGQERVNFAMRQSRDSGRPLSAVQEGWVRELADARAALTARQRARAAERAPSAADRAGFIPDTPGAPPSRAGGGGRRTATARPVEDLERQREFLRLQGSIELLREQGREREARSQQMTLDTLQLTERYQSAGIANAEAEARAHVEALARAQDSARAIEAGRDITRRWLEMAAQAQADLTRQTATELQYRAEIASLEGDPAAVERAERALFIHQRTNELLAERPGLITAAQAAAQAGEEWDALDTAERRGQLRLMFRDTFSDGIRAAIDGDLGGFFENLADRFTDRMLDNLADDLFDLLDGAMSGKGGGGWMSAIGSALFGGAKLPGFKTGGSFRVGGSGGPDSQLTAFRTTPGEMVDIRKPGQDKGGGSPVHFDLRGAVMTSDLLRQMEGMATQSAQVSIQTSRRAIPAEQARRAQFSLGQRTGGLKP